MGQCDQVRNMMNTHSDFNVIVSMILEMSQLHKLNRMQLVIKILAPRTTYSFLCTVNVYCTRFLTVTCHLVVTCLWHGLSIRFSYKQLMCRLKFAEFLTINVFMLFFQLEMADICAKSERYVGTQGGGMDQSISFLAEAGSVSLKFCT